MRVVQLRCHDQVALSACPDVGDGEFTDHLLAAGIDASIGSVGDACDNALAESTIGLYKTEPGRNQKWLNLPSSSHQTHNADPSATPSATSAENPAWGHRCVTGRAPGTPIGWFFPRDGFRRRSCRD